MMVATRRLTPAEKARPLPITGVSRFWRGIAASLALLLGPVANAPAISLSQFVADVINADPTVREQVHVYRQATQEHEIALAGWRPSLDLSATTGRFSREAPNTSQQRRDFNSYQADLTLSQNLFNGYDTTHQIEQARARISSAAYRLYDTADNVALDAIQAYVDVLSEEELVRLAVQNVESHARILDKISERNLSGIGRRSEVEQTEGRLASAHASLIAQQNNLEDALTRLHKALGRYLSPEQLEKPTAPAPPKGELQTLVDTALREHPALRSAKFNIDAAQADYRRSKRSDLPQLDLQLQQSLGDNVGGNSGQTDERSLLLSLQYNLFRGGADRAEQKRKISVVHENQAFLARVHRQVIDALRLAWTADQALQGQLPYLDEHVDKAEQTVELYSEEFFLQKRDLIDLLDAEGELNTARVRQTEARYAGLLARFRVHEAMGMLFEPVGLSVDVSDTDLRVANIQASGEDTLPFKEDRDSDSLADTVDQCDNSGNDMTVDAYGCDNQTKFEFGYGRGNTSPAPVDDELTTEMDIALLFEPSQLLENDTDADGDRLSLESFLQPGKGSLMSDADGSLIYAPKDGFTGTDSFEYTVSDGRGGTGRAQVNIRVVAPKVQSVPETETVRFGYKGLELDAESEARVVQLAEILKDQAEVRIDVSAHTDNVGSRAYNRRLSQWRADALRQLLINLGIDASRVDAVGKGEDEPIADNATEDGRARNRRGEILFKLEPLANPSEMRVEPTSVSPVPSSPAVTPFEMTAESAGDGVQSEVTLVNFAYKALTLTPDSESQVDVLVAHLTQAPLANVEIRTYTDNVGPASYNRRLSEQRAEALRQLLLDKGVEEIRISAFGMGENNPIADNATEDGRAQNRRGEIRLQAASTQ